MDSLFANVGLYLSLYRSLCVCLSLSVTHSLTLSIEARAMDLDTFSMGRDVDG